MTPPRYSAIAFPAYRFVPGTSPHPRRNALGHSYGKPEPRPASLQPAEWWNSGEYLFGIDLFNHGYWWESHESFEALWNATGHDTPPGQFVQGLVFAAAAQLKRLTGTAGGGRSLLKKAIARLEAFPTSYLGVDLDALRSDLQAALEGSASDAIVIRLHIPHEQGTH